MTVPLHVIVESVLMIVICALIGVIVYLLDHRR